MLRLRLDVSSNCCLNFFFVVLSFNIPFDSDADAESDVIFSEFSAFKINGSVSLSAIQKLFVANYVMNVVMNEI